MNKTEKPSSKANEQTKQGSKASQASARGKGKRKANNTQRKRKKFSSAEPIERTCLGRLAFWWLGPASLAV